MVYLDNSTGAIWHCITPGSKTWYGSGVGPSSNIVKVAEDYSGADFSDQIQAAQDASPVGGTILITESHTMTGQADLDQPNTTITCAPDVTITQGGAAQTTFSITAANNTIRDCRFDGKKNTVAATWVKIGVNADGTKLLRNTVHDYRTKGVLLDPASLGTLIEDVTIEGNRIDNTLDTTGVVVTGDLIGANLNTNVANLKIINNTLISRDSGGDPFFLFAGITSKNILVSGNFMEVEGRDAGNTATACMELAVRDAATITHPDDYMTGVVLTGNTCHSYDFVESGLTFGMMRGGTFSNNVYAHLGTNTAYPNIYGAEYGQIYEVAITGNTLTMPIGKGISIHEAQYVTFSGNVVEFENIGSALSDGLRIRQNLDPATHLPMTGHITVTGNVFKSPTNTSGVNQYPINVECRGETFVGMNVDDIVIDSNVFVGTGSPGGGALSAAVFLGQFGTQGNCTIDRVQVTNNAIDGYDHAIQTNNHVFTDITLAGNTLRNIAVSPILVGNAASTGFYVKGEGAEPPITAAQCAVGSLWVDTVLGGALCATAAVGDLCSCSPGVAWVVH
jgi:hypothetical protein